MLDIDAFDSFELRVLYVSKDLFPTELDVLGLTVTYWYLLGTYLLAVFAFFSIIKDFRASQVKGSQSRRGSSFFVLIDSQSRI